MLLSLNNIEDTSKLSIVSDQHRWIDVKNSDTQTVKTCTETSEFDENETNTIIQSELNRNNNDNNNNQTTQSIVISIKNKELDRHQTNKSSTMSKSQNINKRNERSDSFRKLNSFQMKRSESPNKIEKPNSDYDVTQLQIGPNEILNHKFQLSQYSPEFNDNQQFFLRYKDPKSGKVVNKSILNQNLTIDTAPEELDHSSKHIKPLTSREQSKSARVPSSITLFRSQSTKISSQKHDRVQTPTYMSNNVTPSHSSVSNYSWKAKNERTPVSLAPDRLYINTYLIEGSSNQATKTKSSNYSPRVLSRHSFSESKTPLSTSQVFEKIFDMNSQFINNYLPQIQRQRSTKKYNKAHILPGHITLETSIDNINNSSSKRPLKFENPLIYPTQKLESRSHQPSARTIRNNDHDIQAFGIPIVLKNPNSVNSYLNYLKTKNDEK